MKKIICLLLVLILMLSININVFAADNIYVILDGNYIEFDVMPQIINGRTMVPIRAIFEKMGAIVEWDATTGSAICTKGDTVVKMTVDSMDMYINGQVTKMDIAPVIIKGRTLAPARYVAEAFGADVQWSQKTKTVVIGSKDVYAYAEYPDIPDLGRCYNIPVANEGVQNGYKVFSYLFSDTDNEESYERVYEKSASSLGEYVEDIIDTTDDVVTKAYTKSGETEPKYFVAAGNGENDSIIFVVMIPVDTVAEKTESKVTLYALDGRTIKVSSSEVKAYLNVGWYKTLKETQQTMYSADGRTITVYKAEVPAYKKVGWYETLAETQQTMYAADGRTITVNRAEVPAYKKVGWYETRAEASAANQNTNNSTVSYNSYNPTADGNYYRTPTGERYHLDPDCGGKNSYLITEYEAILSGLTPCTKCAE